jgi:site-specific recombinase XerD
MTSTAASRSRPTQVNGAGRWSALCASCCPLTSSPRGRDGSDLVFGRSPTLPFIPTTIRSRALKAWNAAGLKPLMPHEARHCAASHLTAAGLNPKKLSEYIGHSDIRTTYNV